MISGLKKPISEQIRRILGLRRLNRGLEGLRAKFELGVDGETVKAVDDTGQVLVQGLVHPCKHVTRVNHYSM